MTEAAPRNAWALMREGPFSRLWRAGLISSIGDWVAILATLSLAEELAGGGGIVLALVSRILPGLFFAAVGGVVADRLNRKTVMLIVEFGRAGLVLSLAFVGSIGMLVLVNLLLEALTLVFQPAKEATVPNLVERTELVQANSLSLSAAYGTFPLGAAIFLAIAPLGDDITFWGLLPGTHEGLAFLVDACTYLASALIITGIPSQPRRQDAAGVAPRKRKRDFWGPVRDLSEGVAFVATHPRVRPVMLAMTTALAGGGIVIVLGKPYATDVLMAGGAGFPALLTAFGLGAGTGIVLVTIFGPRLTYKDVSFSIALLVTGFGLGASGVIQTVLGGVGWITVMGLGAGSGYVLGFAHMHEQVDDDVRGRTFAALFSLMRIGLLTSMMVALPLSNLFDDLLPGMLAEGSRIVLLLGGVVIFISGVLTLWSVRNYLLNDPDADAKRLASLEAATNAFRSYRRRQSGGEETVEMEAFQAESEASERRPEEEP
ncbi:MAG TPA: MFS transporter [Acidimicrobiia bacterium]|nr:MFS transporter [Acidimicrobiia bacterium]